MLRLELVADEFQEEIIEVVAAQLRVAVAGEDLDDALLRLNDGDVERAPRGRRLACGAARVGWGHK